MRPFVEGLPWEDFREKVLKVREEEVQISRHQNIIDEVPRDCRLSGTLPGCRQPQYRLPARCLSQTRLRLRPPAGLFDIIILFIGGNDLYNFTEPSLTPARKVADDIVELANFLCNRAPFVFVLRVPERDENKTRSKAVNDLLQNIAERKPKKP